MAHILPPSCIMRYIYTGTIHPGPHGPEQSRGGTMLEIDGSRYSGSGTIVRQAVVFAALTGQAVHIVKARVRRPQPGLRPQHVRVIEAIRQLVGGQTEGVVVSAQEFAFWPAMPPRGQQYRWDIGS